MAERRMFTKKVTDADAFIALGSPAQALYLHLVMGADDDGFNNQVQIAMFKAHASVDDLKILMAKRFILQFDNGVIVIKHWRMANALRKDRYTETAFQDELAMLDIKDSGSYTLVASRLPNGCQVVAPGKDRVGKDREDKNKDIYVPVDEVIDYFNSKTNSHYRHSESSRKPIAARLNEGFTVEDCKSVIDKKCAEWIGTDMEKYLTPETLFRPSKFEKYLNQSTGTAKPQEEKGGWSFADYYED